MKIRQVRTAFESKVREPGGMHIRQALVNARANLVALAAELLPLVDAALLDLERAAPADRRPTEAELQAIHDIADRLMGYCSAVDLPGFDEVLLRICRLADAIRRSCLWDHDALGPPLKLLRLVRLQAVPPEVLALMLSELDACVDRFNPPPPDEADAD